MKTIIRHTTRAGDWILDPYAGSGTTLVAAYELNRNAIGIEINHEYVSIIKRRLETYRQTRRLIEWAG